MSVSWKTSATSFAGIETVICLQTSRVPRTMRPSIRTGSRGSSRRIANRGRVRSATMRAAFTTSRPDGDGTVSTRGGMPSGAPTMRKETTFSLYETAEIPAVKCSFRSLGSHPSCLSGPGKKEASATTSPVIVWMPPRSS